MTRALFLILSLLLIPHLASAIMLIGKNTSLSFDDIDADFSKSLSLSLFHRIQFFFPSGKFKLGFDRM